MGKKVVGRKEWAALPDLNLPAVKVRVDSGAKTSSLHAFNMQPFERDGVEMVQFNVHPLQNNLQVIVTCEAPLVDRRVIKSSNGESEKRLVIKTPITMGQDTWDIEITLTNRIEMGFRMLLGREAMQGRVLVDPDAVYVMRQIADEKATALYHSTQTSKAGLNIGLVANNPDLYSNKRIMEAGEARGHNMFFVKVPQVYMNINSKNPQVHYQEGEMVESLHAVIPRLRPSMTFYGCALTRHFQSMGVFCLNEAVPIARSRDKLRSLQLMSEKGLDMPVTGFANSPRNTKDLIKMVGGAPLVIKLLEGTQGRGVVLAETDKAAESVINSFKSLKANILVQEFIAEASGHDIRCLVIDDQVVGAMERVATEPGEFRANVHLGARVQQVELTKEEEQMAINATEIMGLQVAGVDIIRSDRGPMILEVNSSPGLEGIEAATGKDIAGLMIAAIERHMR